MRKLTNKEFLKKLEKIHGDEFTPLEKYINTKTPIKFICSEGHEFTSRPLHITGKNPTGCPQCAIKKVSKANTYTRQDILDKLYDLVGTQYEIVD